VTGTLGAEFRSIRDAAVLFSMALALGLLALTSPVTTVDRHIGEAVRSVQTAWLTSLFRGFTDLASLWWGLLIALGALLTLVVRRRLPAGVWALAVILGGWGVAWGLGELYNRPRPPRQFWLVPVEAGCSYPSPHVAFAMGCALAAYGLGGQGRYRQLVVSAGAVSVSLMSIGLLYLGVEHFTDIVGALLVSAAIAVFLDAYRPGRPCGEDLAAWPQP
jgi:membrane-associated phospholipid phosphatase